MMYGLVGRKLKHSFSKSIHSQLGNDHYKLYETNDIKNFLEKKAFVGINVTIPYKTEVIPYLDELDDLALKTNSVNTIINKDGKLIGYNTDYYGLKASLGFYNITVEDKSVIILGNGSVSNTVVELLNNQGCKKLVRLSRTVRSNIDDKFENYNQYLDYDIVINTTPVGMYPNNDSDCLIDLSKLKNLETFIDLIYNPLRTKMMLDAQILGAKAINGLYMLVLQAKKAHELFFGKDIPLNVANKIYKKIYNNLLNYVFIGLPLSGKSKYASLLSDISNKSCIDTDDSIVEKYQLSIPEIFLELGEKTFRKYEADMVLDIYKNHSTIISTGGGLIEHQANIDLLKQNGVIIYLEKNVETIAKKKIYGRPLIKNSKDILELAKKRIPMYSKNSDIKVTISKETSIHLNEIKEKINEYICG